LITSALPPAVGGQCRHAVIRGSELRITVDTSSQASILRFHQPVLVEKLHSAGYPQVRMIRLQASPNNVSGSTVIRQRPLPGKNIAGVIATSAAACQEPEIQAALIRLANTLEGLQDSTSITDPNPSAAG
jgi:hypothetical protein